MDDSADDSNDIDDMMVLETRAQMYTKIAQDTSSPDTSKRKKLPPRNVSLYYLPRAWF